MTKDGRWAEMPARSTTPSSTLTAHGTPTAVAAKVVDRFGGRADRIGFYTPYAIADDTLGEIIDALQA